MRVSFETANLNQKAFLMQIIHQFTGPSRKGADFYGWAGPVVEWAENSTPRVAFGDWKRDPATGGGAVAFECQPFQLCMYGANSPKMAARDKFTYFAFAGLGAEGRLRLQRLPEGTDAREVFEVGNWTPPSVAKMTGQITSLADIEFQGQLEQAIIIMKLCSDGFGMDIHLPRGAIGPSDKLKFIEAVAATAAKWPQLSELVPAIGSFLEFHVKEWRSRRESGAEARKSAFEKAVSEVQATGSEITPVRIAAWMMGLREIGESIPHEVKEKAQKLKKEFSIFFAGNDETA